MIIYYSAELVGVHSQYCKARAPCGRYSAELVGVHSQYCKARVPCGRLSTLAP